MKAHRILKSYGMRNIWDMCLNLNLLLMYLVWENFLYLFLLSTGG